MTINAAELVKVPKPTRRPIAPLDVEQARAFLRSPGASLGALFSVALACGLRLGEATGLRWDDVDLETGELRVRQQLQKVGKHLVLQALKTPRADGPRACRTSVLKALKAHRTRQLADRLKAGERWVDTASCSRPIGVPRRARAGMAVGAGLHPRNVLRLCTRCSKRRTSRAMRFHDLRHSAASLLIAAGVELVEVSMLLGHSELRVTADFYGHLQKQTAAKAARRMDACWASARVSDWGSTSLTRMRRVRESRRFI